MKPSKCFNCGSGIWLEVQPDKGRKQEDIALDNYCNKCKRLVKTVSRIVTRKRKVKQTEEELDRELISEQRNWL